MTTGRDPPHERRDHDPPRRDASPTTAPARTPSGWPGGSPRRATSSRRHDGRRRTCTAASSWARSCPTARRSACRSRSWAGSRGGSASTRSSPASSPATSRTGLRLRLKLAQRDFARAEGIALHRLGLRPAPGRQRAVQPRQAGRPGAALRREHVRPAHRRPQRRRPDRPPDRRVGDLGDASIRGRDRHDRSDHATTPDSPRPGTAGA